MNGKLGWQSRDESRRSVEEEFVVDRCVSVQLGEPIEGQENLLKDRQDIVWYHQLPDAPCLGTSHIFPLFHLYHTIVTTGYQPHACPVKGQMSVQHLSE